MMCPICGTSDTRVLDTRPQPYGTVKRRHLCGNGHRFETRQIYEACYSPARTRCAGFFATVQRRLALWRRNHAIKAALARGDNWRDVAAEHGLTPKAVWWIKKHK